MKYNRIWFIAGLILPSPSLPGLDALDEPACVCVCVSARVCGVVQFVETEAFRRDGCSLRLNKGHIAHFYQKY